MHADADHQEDSMIRRSLARVRPALIGVGIIAALLPAVAWTQADYPNRQSRIVIPFGPSGGNDITARILAGKLSEAYGQPVIVENRPGASGAIAADAVMKAAPDGYTILMGPSGVMSANPAINPKLAYQPLRDFLPVTMVGSFPLVLVVNANLPVKTVGDLVTHAKAKPNEVNYASTSALFQLTSEMFNQRTGVKFQHIPYKSSADCVNAVLAGDVTMFFSDPPPATAHIKSGRLRALAVAGNQRHPSWPDVPTLAEAGVADMAFAVWMGLFLPAATPPAIAQRLQSEIAKILQQPDVQQRMAGLGIDPSGMRGDEFRKIVEADIARWTAVAKAGNIKAE